VSSALETVIRRPGFLIGIGSIAMSGMLSLAEEAVKERLGWVALIGLFFLGLGGVLEARNGFINGESEAAAGRTPRSSAHAALRCPVGRHRLPAGPRPGYLSSGMGLASQRSL